MEFDRPATANAEDKEILLAIIDEIAKSMTGEQSTRHWAANAVWFDIPAFASIGVEPAKKLFDEVFGQLKSNKVEIIETKTFINGDMGVVCSIQKWSMEMQNGEKPTPLLVRQTNCFERQNGQWKVIHEHSSVPSTSGWDGKFVS